MVKINSNSQFSVWQRLSCIKLADANLTQLVSIIATAGQARHLGEILRI